MQEEGDFDLHKIDAGQLKPDSYILLESAQDRDGAHRWNIANSIRRKNYLSAIRFWNSYVQMWGSP